ncbi:hypothetical protein GCM10023169_15850 [Georgenia halophila]|uniref:SurA N-terminal domain-containing protein n=1 Tax=Georgenia halophila TaxID=620889 RepID=A0ABP8L4N1_9MICO
MAPPRRTLVRSTAALLAAGAAVAGCSAQPGTAATVNDTRITENEVASATAQWIEISGQQVTPGQVAHILVQAELFEPIATEGGFGYSDQQVEQLLKDAAAAQGQPAPEEISEPAVDLARFVLQQGDVTEAQNAGELLSQLDEATAEADIEVNPRYGTRNDSGQIVQTTYEWIHQEQQPTPAPAG